MFRTARRRFEKKALEAGSAEYLLRDAIVPADA